MEPPDCGIQARNKRFAFSAPNAKKMHGLLLSSFIVLCNNLVDLRKNHSSSTFCSHVNFQSSLRNLAPGNRQLPHLHMCQHPPLCLNLVHFGRNALHRVWNAECVVLGRCLSVRVRPKIEKSRLESRVGHLRRQTFSSDILLLFSPPRPSPTSQLLQRVRFV